MLNGGVKARVFHLACACFRFWQELETSYLSMSAFLSSNGLAIARLGREVPYEVVSQSALQCSFAQSSQWPLAYLQNTAHDHALHVAFLWQPLRASRLLPNESCST